MWQGAPSYLHDMGNAEQWGWPGFIAGAGSCTGSGCYFMGVCSPEASQVPPGSPKPMLLAAGRGTRMQVVAQKALSSSE